MVSALVACNSDSTNDLGVDAAPGSSTDATTGGNADATLVASDPADDGAFAVTTKTASIAGSAAGRTLASTIFTPTGAPSPRPLVVVSPGFQMDPAQYTSYAEHLASWGFVVILTGYDEFLPNHEAASSDIVSVVTYALGQSSLAIDPARIAAAA
jgi:hypothetical protein